LRGSIRVIQPCSLFPGTFKRLGKNTAGLSSDPASDAFHPRERPGGELLPSVKKRPPSFSRFIFCQHTEQDGKSGCLRPRPSPILYRPGRPKSIAPKLLLLGALRICLLLTTVQRYPAKLDRVREPDFLKLPTSDHSEKAFRESLPEYQEGVNGNWNIVLLNPRFCVTLSETPSLTLHSCFPP
jgi:hypothetical protein